MKNSTALIVALLAVAIIALIKAGSQQSTRESSELYLDLQGRHEIAIGKRSSRAVPEEVPSKAQNVEAFEREAVPAAVKEEAVEVKLDEPPSLRQELANLKEQLRLSTAEQFKIYWDTGNYTEHQTLTRAALTDGEGNPVPNEVRIGVNGGFRVVALRPETHPEACTLMLNIQSLEAEIKALEASL